MVRTPMPLPVLLICVVSFAGYLWKHRRKSWSSRHPVIPKKDYLRVWEIQNEFDDYKSESFEAMVLDPSKAKITLRHPLGSPISLTKTQNCINVEIDGIVAFLKVPFDSEFRELYNDKLTCRAFITDRDICASGFYDFFTVTVFYKPN